MNAGCEIIVQDALGTDPGVLTRLEVWLTGVVAHLAPDATTFTVRLTGDGEVRALNAKMRGKEAPTDVLSFPGGTTVEGFHLGDVVISLDTARRQAAELSHGLERELEELLLHALLHCLGHDHETDTGEMAALELELRERWIEDG